MAISDVKSRREQVEAEVRATATTTIEEITQQYGTACRKFTEFFMKSLKAAIKALNQIMDLLDSMKKEVDFAFESQAKFPDLPELDFDLGGGPFVEFGDLKCPLAQCLGFPPLPTISFPNGLGENPLPGIVESFKKFGRSLAQFGKKLGQWVGDTLAINARNALEFLNKAPQAILNGLVDTFAFLIANIINVAFLELLDITIGCLIKTDPKFAKTEEIVRYKALRKRYTAKSGGSFNLNPLSSGPLDQVKKFKSQKDKITGALSASDSLRNAF